MARNYLSSQQFVRLVCPSVEELGFTTDQVPELDDVCGAGTSAGLDPSAGDYLTMIEDAVILLQDDVGLSIPAAEIGIYCQVPWLTNFVLFIGFL